MAHLHRSVATLRIAGDELVPSEITALLGAEPTLARTKGQEIQMKTGRTRVAKMGQWHLNAADTVPESLDSQVSELLNKLTNNLSIWGELSSRFEIDLFCGWFMEKENEGVEISADTLKALGVRGIMLGIDIYSPDIDA